MKSIIKSLMRSIIVLLAVSISLTAVAGKKGKVTKTSLTVHGVCGDCKERIQEAAFAVKGVKAAEWNKKTKVLKVAYSADKCTQLQIEEAMAAIGHDTDNVKAKDAVYNKLPGCCAYRTNASCNK